MKHRQKTGLVALSALVFGALLPAPVNSLEPTPTVLASRVDAPSSAQSAANYVELLGSRAITVSTSNAKVGADQRHERLKTLIRESFDLELIGRFVLGRFWREATTAQRTDFQELYAHHLVSSYARQLDAYEAETLTVISSRDVSKKDVLVETEINSASGPVKAGWRVRSADNSRKIVDVEIDGISMALSHRQEFGSVANRAGVDGLIKIMKVSLNKQTARLDDNETMPDSNAKAMMLFSVVGSSGMPWQVALVGR